MEKSPRRLAKWRPVLIVITGIVALTACASAVFYDAMYAEFRVGLPLKSLVLLVKCYGGDDAQHRYPPLSSKPGRLLFDMDAMYPKYISDGWELLSPADPIGKSIRNAHPPVGFYFDHCSYYYLGFVVWNDASALAFASAYKKQVNEGHPAFDNDLEVASPIVRLTRLTDSVSRQMLTDAEAIDPKWEYLRHSTSEIPVLIEKPHPYGGGLGFYSFGGTLQVSSPMIGGVVAYQDGHVEFIRFPGKWPMTEKTISALSELESLGKTSSQ